MCFELTSRPPIPEISGAAVDTQDLTLTSLDGVKFSAFSAKAAGSTGGKPAVVVLPDVRGLYRFYEELALRFAERGYDAVAIDYFGRTAGLGKRADTFAWQEHVAQTKGKQLAQDVAAAVSHLRQGHNNAARPIFTMGFCFGGGLSFQQAAEGHGLAGVIGFYGHPTRPGRDGGPAAIDRVNDMKCAVLGLMGGADAGIPAEEVAKFDKALENAKVKHEIITYQGAPHSFFDRTFKEHADASANAWDRTLKFIQENSKTLVRA